MRLAAPVVALAVAWLAPAAAQARPAAARDWSKVVTATPAGGFQMGNPKARVALIEYGSLTCPHCRHFDETGIDPLVQGYVKPGKVRYEFRNYVFNGFDIAATLVARCNGPGTFFPIARALYRDQEQWLGRAEKLSDAQAQALQDLPADRQFIEVAKAVGLQPYAAARGVPPAKLAACLADTKSVDRLIETVRRVSVEYPGFPGTPTFILNGKMLDRTASWKDLEPKLKAALGG